ncbi:YkgJ family cysteine cluster protein [Paenibacillus dauci]|uniref:YkgJ family cysteine cluster protein n=1 Tax=Paenibacillus dauci TaxID=1567106 RepID=UPI000619DE05|nr:YkgJ family cysteine cluster protein [Paenibacillus dauci]
MECRPGCAACCIIISISSPIPGMPKGKPAGTPCIHLTSERRCGLFGQPERPEVCGGLAASLEMCGTSDDYAFAYLEELERLTAPDMQS